MPIESDSGGKTTAPLDAAQLKVAVLLEKAKAAQESGNNTNAKKYLTQALQINKEALGASTPAPVVNTQAAVAKLTSGQPLTLAEKAALNIAPSAEETKAALAKLTSGQTLSNAEKAILNIQPAAPKAGTLAAVQNAVKVQQKAIDATGPTNELIANADSTLEEAKKVLEEFKANPTSDNQIKLDDAIKTAQAASDAAGNSVDVLTDLAGTSADAAAAAAGGTGSGGASSAGGGGAGGGGGGGGGSGGGGAGGGGGNVNINAAGTQIYTASDGKTFTDQAAYAAYEANLQNLNASKAAQAAADKAARQSAYDLLYAQFKQYGLESLVEGIKGLIEQNVSPSEFAIRLQDTDAYKKRFAANQDRIKAGLRALTPAEYIGLEDQYQNIMRNYGLPASYYTKGDMGIQEGFNKFIANDVSAAELEDRIATAQKRVLNADPNVTDALRQFYPDITNADILAYTLDPTNALENIKRKVTAAEIGGAALSQGLGTNVNRAEELAKYGVTKTQAQQGYSTIGEFLPTAQKLGDIYSKQGLGAYDQATAESEIFNTANAAQAAQKRKKLTQLEQAQFGGSSGQAQGALARDRAGSI